MFKKYWISFHYGLFFNQPKIVQKNDIYFI